MEKRIEVSVGFAAMVCVLGWFDLKICGCFLAAMTVHELAHLIVIRLFRIPVNGVSLRLSGAVIRCGFCGYGQEAVCAAAGPAANFFLGLALMRIAPQLAAVSFLLGAGNLLPVYPLDGGRILRALLSRKKDEETVLAVLSRVTFVICCLLMTVACWLTAELQMGLWPVFAALIILCRVGTVKWTEP